MALCNLALKLDRVTRGRDVDRAAWAAGRSPSIDRSKWHRCNRWVCSSWETPDRPWLGGLVCLVILKGVIERLGGLPVI